MKLYTEEQIKMMLARAKLYRGAVYDNFEFIMSDDQILDSETHIKLPSIDEIRNECNVDNLNTNQQYLFELGGTWVCDEIQKRSKKLNTITNIQAQIISNNKQSMKLYTQEQLDLAFLKGHSLGGLGVNFTLEIVEDMRKELTPIEIPSDEEIKHYWSKTNITPWDIAAINGSLVIVEQIKKGTFLK